MRKQRNALIGALAWWFARRWLQRRATLAVPGTTGSSGRGRIGAVLGSVVLVGAVVAGFLFWRKRSGKSDLADGPSPAPARPAETSPAPTQPPRDAPPPPAAA